MFCHYCGKEIKDGASFCMYCGKQIAKSDIDKAEGSSTHESIPADAPLTQKGKRAAAKAAKKTVQKAERETKSKAPATGHRGKRFLLCFAAVAVIAVGVCLSVRCFLAGTGNGRPVKLVDSIDQIQGMQDYAPTGSLSKAFSENVYYAVSNISWEGDSGVAEVKITTPDLAQVISDSIRQAVDERGTEDYGSLLEQAEQNVQTTLNSEDYPVLESTVEMEAEKTDDGYTLISNEEFERIISGRLEEIFLEALMEGLANEDRA